MFGAQIFRTRVRFPPSPPKIRIQDAGFYIIRQTRPFRYSLSGKFRATGWSLSCDKYSNMLALTPASRAASATIFWNKSLLIPPEHEKVNSIPPGFNNLNASRLISLYPLEAADIWALVGANLGGSIIITSNFRSRSRIPLSS